MECYDFEYGESYYFVDVREMRVKEFMIFTNMSLSGANILSNIFKIHKKKSDAEDALNYLKKHFILSNE